MKNLTPAGLVSVVVAFAAIGGCNPPPKDPPADVPVAPATATAAPAASATGSATAAMTASASASVASAAPITSTTPSTSDAGGKPAPGGAKCSTDADCHTFASYCAEAPCACRVLGKGEGDPKCAGAGPKVNCLVNPCMNKAAHCQSGACVLTVKGATEK